MTDIGPIPLRAAGAPPAQRTADAGRGFERALERSGADAAQTAAPARPVDAAAQIAQQRLDEARRAQARTPQPTADRSDARAAAARAEARAGADRSDARAAAERADARVAAERNDVRRGADAGRSDAVGRGEQAGRSEQTAAAADRASQPAPAADSAATRRTAEAAHGSAPGDGAGAASTDAAADTFADQTTALVAASAALSALATSAPIAPPAALTGAAAGAADAGADAAGADVAADVALDLAGRSAGATAAAATPDSRLAAADDGANGRRPTGALPVAAAPEDAAQAAALPAFTAELTRSAAKDRLTEDFERRFETSLARTVGAGSSPLAAAGLPPLAGPPPPAPHIAGAVQAAVAAPIGHPAFADDLSYRVLMFTGQRLHSAELTVTPAELGPVKVSIELRGQEAALQFTAAHATTRAALEDALPRLREMLAAQGLQLIQANVGDAPRQGSGGAGNDQAAHRDSGRSASSDRADGGARAATGAAAPGRARIGLIDIHV